jgi:hypothetical protein
MQLYFSSEPDLFIFEKPSCKQTDLETTFHNFLDYTLIELKINLSFTEIADGEAHVFVRGTQK